MPINAEIPLGIKPPAVIDPLEAYSRILGVQGKQQEIQNQQDQHQANTAIASENFKRLQQQNAEAQQKAKEQEILRQAYVNSNGKPEETVNAAIQAGAGPEAVQGLQTHFATLAEHAAKTGADQIKIDEDKNNKFLALHDTALGLDDQQLAQAWPQIYAQIATLDPNAAKSLNPEQPPSKSDILVSRASHQTLGYNLAQETEKRAKAKADEEAAAAARAAKLGINTQLESDARTPVVQATSAATLADPNLLTPAERGAETDRQAAAAATKANEEANRALTQRGQDLTNARAIEGRDVSAIPGLANVPKALQAPAAAAFSKSSLAYADAKASADELQGVINLVRAGNKAAGSNLPMLGVGSLNAINGIKRMNSAEINQYKGAGSLLDSITGKISGLALGQPIPKDVLDDIESLHKKLAEGAYSKHAAEVDAINQSHGSSFKPTEQPKASANAAQGGYQVGRKYGNLTYQGGDPNSQSSWK